ncbi:MAG: hypothetical protein LBK53_03160 [Heliobacteriaceae bacterium]|nr:hypothetical protein [Heliobacteriaceae bacterium]
MKNFAIYAVNKNKAQILGITMGLSAQQCRLLTITGRKHNCELNLMNLSGEKSSLARSMDSVSNEYMNSLTQTKLVYDYYGKDDQTVRLDYDILMTPNGLNDQIPVTVLDKSGRVVLNRKLAAAARNAGIPEEGINSSSVIMRDRFVDELYNQGAITSLNTVNEAKSSPYDPLMGVEDWLIVDSGADKVNKTGLLQYIFDTLTDSTGGNEFAVVSSDYGYARFTGEATQNGSVGLEMDGHTMRGRFTLYDLLKGDHEYSLIGVSGDATSSETSASEEAFDMNAIVENYLIDWIREEFSKVFDMADPDVSAALMSAAGELKYFFDGSASVTEKFDKSDDTLSYARGNDSKYLGLVEGILKSGNRKCNAAAGINLNNVANAYLTLFAKYVSNDTDNPYKDKYLTNDLVSDQKFVTDNSEYLYPITKGESYKVRARKNPGFYDLLFYQLSTQGWVENNEVNDSKYLQDMFQSGMMFIGRRGHDRLYHKNGYDKDVYIKEVVDDDFIAKAEVRYNARKLQINRKEQILDLKMKNLDTEISALNTEYDTVKSTISKNVEKSFKRFSA